MQVPQVPTGRWLLLLFVCLAPLSLVNSQESASFRFEELEFATHLPEGAVVASASFELSRLSIGTIGASTPASSTTYSFDVGNQSGTVRLGRQVISWGEATFVQGVNALQNPLDAGVARAPGAEVKEFILPTAALNLKWAFNDSFSAEAYYKLDWEKSTLAGVGSYLSASDTTGPGAQRILLGPLGAADVIQAVKPDDDDQYGIALRYLSDRGDNFDISYTKSHANIPGAQIVVDLANRDNSFSREVYLEDIEVWQFSTSFLVSEAQVYADVAYSDNAPFVNTDQVFDAGRLTVSDMERGHYWQVVAGMTTSRLGRYG